MKNKNLITVILIVAVSSLFSSVFTSCTTKKNIGLQLYSIRDSIRKDVPAAIKKVADMGYTFVEPAGYGDGKFYGMEPAAFKTLCDENGIFVLSSHTSRNLPD